MQNLSLMFVAKMMSTDSFALHCFFAVKIVTFCSEYSDTS